ncbi:hypothetical protein P4V86_05705 [Brevibacillus laterosporus]|uniref:hypothetical protein n=1 Tax=Brevibacillus laterosporus TaxID=1465 RepID=UPI000380CAA9|nr:hypothetical protein [Brevibacillus laterosporus]ATO50654.1 hypothetical protein BrL25_17065 [Brevibacillus laterosporus DSM 25]MBG9775115.1 hypothetical protein [Brevibacillus laterosporus]MBG9804661.1 hypothetical protein [Brevibacillus laterosporus]MED2002852.1 hypothetical protein [Brevibacillus laterosporus]MED4764959.1 hypothetical protein [Brevibacillus laterosporus]
MSHELIVDPRVFPPTSQPAYKSYSDWAIEWWQWAFSIPKAIHPLLDLTGDYSEVHQIKQHERPVWFLAGSYSGRPAVRTCTIPHKKPIFFPVCSAVSNDIFLPKITGMPLDLSGGAKYLADHIVEANVVLDGYPIKTEVYRVSSPIFPIQLPYDNLLDIEVPVGTCKKANAATDGFWLMLKPLGIGVHQLQLRGKMTLPDTPESYVTEVTYELLVK